MTGATDAPTPAPVAFREATEADVPAIVALLADDSLGKGRESTDMTPYLAAFRAMQDEPHNSLIVGTETGGAVVACVQLTLLSGLSLTAARRAQIEGVRVAAHLRGQRVGEALIADAEARARAAGATWMQFTTNKTRTDAHRFYDRLGYDPSHIGYKKRL